MIAAVPIGVAALLYGLGVRRYDSQHPAEPFARARVAAFYGGLLSMLLVLVGPLHELVERRFWIHMIQHLVLVSVSAPLLLLGTPILLLRRASPRGVRRAVVRGLRSRFISVLTFPPVPWLLFTGFMWVSHYSALYEASLRSEAVHVLEHVLYLSFALLFWFPVIGLDPSRRRMSYPARLLYLMLAMPQSSFLGASLGSTGRVLYPHYASTLGVRALSDQHAAGAAMWILGSSGMLIASLVLAAAWARHDMREGARLDRVLEAERPV